MEVNSHGLTVIGVFWPRNHAFRRNRTTFRKDRTVTGGPHHRLFGDELYAEVEDYVMVTTNGDFVIPAFKENGHN